MPGQPGSHMDKQFCHDIHRIADALESIAETLEEAEFAQALVRVKPDDIEVVPSQED